MAVKQRCPAKTHAIEMYLTGLYLHTCNMLYMYKGDQSVWGHCEHVLPATLYLSLCVLVTSVLYC